MSQKIQFPNLAVAIPEATNTEYDIIDEELISLITDTANTMEMTQYNEQIVKNTSETTVTKQMVQKKSSPKPTLFANCTFSGNVAININKNWIQNCWKTFQTQNIYPKSYNIYLWTVKNIVGYNS